MNTNQSIKKVWLNINVKFIGMKRGVYGILAKLFILLWGVTILLT